MWVITFQKVERTFIAITYYYLWIVSLLPTESWQMKWNLIRSVYKLHVIAVHTKWKRMEPYPKHLHDAHTQPKKNHSLEILFFHCIRSHSINFLFVYYLAHHNTHKHTVPCMACNESHGKIFFVVLSNKFLNFRHLQCAHLQPQL